MKHLTAAILALCLSACIGLPVEPAPEAKQGNFEILEFNAPGNVVRRYQVNSYEETMFPSTVTFQHQGTTITLRGSYQINEFAR
jgi:hypothetical protein